MLAHSLEVLTRSTVEYQIPWDDEEFDRASAVALFDALASKEKTLHAQLGQALPGVRIRARQLGSVLRPPPRAEDNAMSACDFRDDDAS